MRQLLLIGTLLCAIGLSQHPASRATACATAKREKDPPVAIATESALIIWDEMNKRQHFIRRASFQTQASHFGFLVPTPTAPDYPLTEVSDDLFTTLEEWTKPKIVTRYEFDSVPFGCAGSEDKATKSSGVELLGQGQVAGLLYSVLKATDPQELGAWLRKHDYEWTASQEKWIAPYVEEGWIVTAFQNKRVNQTDKRLSMKAVRMSLTTERPFFPYREPATERPGKGSRRLLRVFLVANQRMEGKLEDADWSGRAKWANPLSASQRQEILEKLDDNGVMPEEAAWLTVLDDDATIRANSEVYFSPSADQSTLERITNKVVAVPFVVSCLFSCLTLFGAPLMWYSVLLYLRQRRTRTAK